MKTFRAPASEMPGRAGSLARLLVFVIAVAGICSCGRQQETVPGDIIPEQQLVGILVDFHLAQAMAQTSRYDQNKDAIRDSCYRVVMAEHRITYPRLKKSMDYYAMHPEKLTAVYEKVIEELSKKQAEAAAG